jgi:SAM-dependent methyltransferase
MWDKEYSVDEYVYGTKPNDFLAVMTRKLKKGRVLCLAEGEGRNAVHLAKEGFTVTAVDSSAVGLAKAKKLAQEYGVRIETIHVDLADFIIDESSWDSIISISCHLPPVLRKQVHKGVVSGLRKGGTFLLEAYTPRQLEFRTGGPPSAEFMMDLLTLKEELSDLRMIHGVELLRNVVEGINHTGKGSVVQVLAEKIQQ